MNPQPFTPAWGVGDFALPQSCSLCFFQWGALTVTTGVLFLSKKTDPTCTHLQMDYGAQKRKEEKGASIVSPPLTVETPFSTLAPTPWSRLSPSLPYSPPNE